MEHIHSHRGFTLIELLVVISLIGILSAIILGSLAFARLKGSDAAIQADLDTIRTQSVIYFDATNNVYGTNVAFESSCTAVDNMFNNTQIKRAAAAADGLNGGNVVCNVSADGTAYAVSARLVSDTTKYWCIDSQSVGVKVSTPLDTATVCPSS
jgi:prepilin-type N-terminal cleavage/methylation domain-containing protein